MNIDIKKSDFHKINLPSDLEDCVVNLKKNLISRESKAWDIAKAIVVFNNDEEYIYLKELKNMLLLLIILET